MFVLLCNDLNSEGPLRRATRFDGFLQILSVEIYRPYQRWIR
jgi:hypothetical protein